MIAFDEAHDPPDSPEVKVSIVVPEEFLGWSISELTSRGGSVAEIAGSGERMIVHGTLRELEFSSLQDSIISATLRRGTVERQKKS